MHILVQNTQKMLNKHFPMLGLMRNLMSTAVNIHMQRDGGTIRHSRFIRERMFLCHRLFHECLGYDLDRISLVAKTRPGLIPESSGFIPFEGLPCCGFFSRLALFRRCGNRKPAAGPRKQISAFCQRFTKDG